MRWWQPSGRSINNDVKRAADSRLAGTAAVKLSQLGMTLPCRFAQGVLGGPVFLVGSPAEIIAVVRAHYTSPANEKLSYSAADREVDGSDGEIRRLALQSFARITD